MNTPDHESDQFLRWSDPNLALLASQAAVEVDEVIRGVQCDMAATHRLAGILASSLGNELANGGRSSLVDPTTVSVLTRAFAESGNESVRTVQELVTEALRIVQSLSNSEEQSEAVSPADIRRFCSALALSAAAHAASAYGDRPPHPDRRLC